MLEPTKKEMSGLLSYYDRFKKNDPYPSNETVFTSLWVIDYKIRWDHIPAWFLRACKNVVVNGKYLSPIDIVCKSIGHNAYDHVGSYKKKGKTIFISNPYENELNSGLTELMKFKELVSGKIDVRISACTPYFPTKTILIEFIQETDNE